MRKLVAVFRLAAVVVITACAAVPPAVLRRLTPGGSEIGARVGSRCAHWWGRGLCAVIGVRREVTGLPRGDVFAVASNHVSYLDIVVLSSLYPSVFVAKTEIASWPVFGWITRNSGTLFVDRDRPRDVVRVGREMTQRLERGTPLTLFPEGRTSSGATILPFLPSLLEPMARAGVPCFGATVGYSVPDGEPPATDVVCWWRGENFAQHFWRMLQLPHIDARIRFGEQPVVDHDRKELSRRLREQCNLQFTPIDGAPGADAT